jgi:hypothetical protein
MVDEHDGGMSIATGICVDYTREDMLTGKLRWETITPAERLPIDDRDRIQLRATGFVVTPGYPARSPRQVGASNGYPGSPPRYAGARRCCLLPTRTSGCTGERCWSASTWRQGSRASSGTRSNGS